MIKKRPDRANVCTTDTEQKQFVSGAAKVCGCHGRATRAIIIPVGELAAVPQVEESHSHFVFDPTPVSREFGAKSMDSRFSPGDHTKAILEPAL
jgi:hypothetical protein